ncbi:MAG: helix-turn-helix domain-containing protein [Clostridia bacterium]|nr:helix-turn-helix domain-containing protein [Clostridia bacterium]
MPRRKFEATQDGKEKNVHPEPLGTGVCDNKLFYAERIKTLRTAAGVTQAELASRLGLTRTAVVNWEQGRSRPDISNIPVLCQALNIPISHLFFSTGSDTGLDSTETHLIQSYRNMNDKHQRFIVKMADELEEMDAPVKMPAPRFRLLSLPYAEDAVAAGVGTDSFEASCSQCYVHDTPKMREADILFHVNGDSMEPTYPDGCTVMVRKSSEVNTGDIGIFSVDGTLFIKEYQPDGLHSINPAYPPLLSKKFGEIRAIGRVIGMMEDDDFASETEIKYFQSQK